jgi:peptide/nickel transport system substrate-binding protein
LNSKHTWIRSASLALAAVLIAGCAAQPVAPSAPAAPKAQEPTSTPAPAAPASQIQKGGTLTIGATEEPDTMNPYLTQLATTFEALTAVMEGLISYNEKGEIVPQLAESYSVSEDGLSYTFKLRKGVTWHDGKPFTSADVKATWEIIMNPDFAAWSTLGWEKIESLETPDDLTVVMKTAEKYAPFMAYVGAGVISPKHVIDGGWEKFKEAFNRSVIGTGPYKLVKWESGQFIELAKNETYWGGTPNLDSIRIKIVPDSNTRMVQLGTGELQVSSVSAEQYEEAKKLPNSQVLLTNGNAWNHLDLKYVDFIMDTRVRQALDYATPRQQIVDSLLSGLADVAVADISPISPYFNPEVKHREYDLDKAAKLIEEAGLKKNAAGFLEKDGKQFDLEFWIISGEQQSKRVQQVIAASWRKLGVNVTEHEEDISSIFGPNGYQFNKKMTAGMYSWFNGNDPDDMFYWHSSQIPKEPTGSGGNTVGYFNQFSFQKEIDDLTAAAAQEVDVTKRKALHFQIQELLQKEVPVIFLYWAKSISVAPKNLANFKPTPFAYTMWNVKEWGFIK